MQNNVLTRLHMNAIDVTYMYTHLPREGRMIRSSVFNWSYIRREIVGRLARRARNRLAFVARVPLSLATFYENWVHPPVAPPVAPPARKFDTSINFGFNQWQINNAS